MGAGMGGSGGLGAFFLNDLNSLFSSGEDGFLFYPQSDLTRQFLLSDGSTGTITTNADPVGLDLDNASWGSGTSLATVLAAATELLIAGSWTMSVVGGTSTAVESPAGTLTLTGDGTNMARGDQSFTTVIGKTYRLNFTAAGNTGPLSVGNGQGGAGLISATFALGQNTYYFVAAATTTWVRVSRTSVGTSVESAFSCKLVPGNHAIQATTTKRPLWTANAGKPYLLFDGVDDTLVSAFSPTAAMTMACAFNTPTISAMMIGGGDSAGNRRAFLSLDASGLLSGGWGTHTQTTIFGGADIRSTDHVGLLTADAATADLYLDGALIYSAASSGTGSGGTGAMALGSFNNGGTPASWSNAREYAALALNRRVNQGEIALITQAFMATYS